MSTTPTPTSDHTQLDNVPTLLPPRLPLVVRRGRGADLTRSEARHPLVCACLEGTLHSQLCDAGWGIVGQ